jgi:hypothetical protein
LAQEEAAEEEQQNRGFLRFELTPHKIQWKEICAMIPDF